jgi:hypothetical protein
MEAHKSTELCGSPRKRGGPCGRPAGWGTPHSTGPCRNHGGLFPTVVKHHARLEALSFARGQLGQELDIDPLEGVLVAVKLAYGVVDYWRHLLAEPEADSKRLHEQFGRALMDYTRICDIAIKAGVSERQIKILERTADQLSLLFEDIAAAANATVEQRRAMTEAWVKGLAKLEAPVIEGTATDLVA